MTVSSPATADDGAVTARETLLALHRDGRLAAAYPRVRRLLAEATDSDLAQYGHLLARLDPAEVLRQHPEQPSISVAVTGHGTLSALVPMLTGELARHGLLLRPFVSAFDSYVFDLSNPDSELYRSAPDIVLCVVDPRVVLDEVPTPWRPADVERVFAEKLELLGRLAARFAATARGTLVLNTIPLPHELSAQLVDHRSRARLGIIWREANGRLLRLVDEHPEVVVVDLDPLVATGLPVTEPRLSVYAKSHLSAEILGGYAREIGHLGRQLAGRTKKTLVLDLDETLWGGILAEEGQDGIEIAGGYRGEAFTSFRRVVKQIGAQGVLLAIVSKNDIERVREVFREASGLVLGEEDFVRIIANWRPKHDNIRELAEALNLGVDSVVFADDSAFECGLVRRALPDVAVVRLAGDPATHVETLLRDGWFDVRELTGEDRARVAKYRDELERKDFLDSFSSLEDYLRELGITVRLAVATEDQVARVAQLTLRTNQFNLTTRRLRQGDVRELMADPRHLVLTIQSGDRFGDNGVVGAIFYRRAGEFAHIDNFLLSCRVFSRGIEQACLAALLRHAKHTGVDAVFGTYRRTAKNGAVSDFYQRMGFVPTEGDDSTSSFRHDLMDIMAPQAHVDLDQAGIGHVYL